MIEILAILLGALTGFVIVNRKEIGSWVKQVRRPQIAADMLTDNSKVDYAANCMRGSDNGQHNETKQLYDPPWPAKGGNTGPVKQ